MKAVVQKWGNSLGLRIPSIWAKDNEVKSGNQVELIVEKGRIIILPHKKSLDEMTDGFRFGQDIDTNLWYNELEDGLRD